MKELRLKLVTLKAEQLEEVKTNKIMKDQLEITTASNKHMNQYLDEFAAKQKE